MKKQITAEEENERHIDEMALTIYKESPNHSLCAWCKHYYHTTEGNRCYPKLTDEQFEETRQNGTSHGICPDCKTEMMNKDRDERAKKATIKKKSNVAVLSTGVLVKVVCTAGEMDDERSIGVVGVIAGVDELGSDGNDTRYRVNVGCDVYQFFHHGQLLVLPSLPMEPVEFAIGTRVVVIRTTDGDERNVGRTGTVIEMPISMAELGATANTKNDALYILEFNDGVEYNPQFWVDEEAKLPLNQSAHYHSEVERV